MIAKARKTLRVITGWIFCGLGLAIFLFYLIAFCCPSVRVKQNPEFIQDMVGILSGETIQFIEPQLRSKVNTTNVCAVLDCQLQSFEITDAYVEKVCRRVIEEDYRSQRYLVMTYFKQDQKLVFTTNIQQDSVQNRVIEGVATQEDLQKEVAYITLKLNDRMKMANGDFTETRKNEIHLQIFWGTIMLIVGFSLIFPEKEHHFVAPKIKPKKFWKRKQLEKEKIENS